MLMAEAREKDLSYLRLVIACRVDGHVRFAFDRSFQFPCASCTPNNRRLAAARLAAEAAGFRLIVEDALRRETRAEVSAWEATRSESKCVCEVQRRAGERARKPNAQEKDVINAQLCHLVRMPCVALAPLPPGSNTNTEHTTQL